MAAKKTDIKRPETSSINDSVPENYQVRIWSNSSIGNKSSVYISSNLPESFSLSVSSSWQQPMNKSFTESLPDNAIGNLGKLGGSIAKNVFGQTTLSKFQTISVWDQGSAMEVSIPMVFRAFNNALDDVTEKVLTLMSMVCPYSQGGALHAPGPNVATMLSEVSSDGDSGEIITLEIGNFISMRPVIIRSVDVEFESKFDSSGNPVVATANVTVETPFIVTRSDLAKYFVHSNNAYKDISDLPSLLKGLTDIFG